MGGFFVTGTDTEIGKTMITAVLTRHYLERGSDTFPYKPVQSGAEWEGEKLTAPDTVFYERFAGREFGPETNTYLLKIPSSPHLAAALEGVKIESQPIVDQTEKLLNSHELVFVEGAGGLIVPLNEEETMIDLIDRLSLPVILVARAGLGTINHTVLSVMALKQRNIKIAGIVLNRVTSDELTEIEEDNRRMLQKLSGVPIIGTFPYITGREIEKLDVGEILEHWNMNILEEAMQHESRKAY
ncbi:dethiobiotin synthase [Rossellomorea aquimaris]|uniref:ATP-dependent dethiobiotin synthetase BioD n=1 Tax=Rossellomorea aquimaris TaxID=189382 RepID=A0A1J6VSN1_9BACI|nr:dethiobiotin synthase [Rossellomorea aquimaris]OIU68766.1 dethiobiotin synthase [Rossellomorea aquimaris]